MFGRALLCVLVFGSFTTLLSADSVPVLVLLPARTNAELQPMLDKLEREGLKPRHVFPSFAVIAERAPTSALRLEAFPKDWILFEDPIADVKSLRGGTVPLEIEVIWNANYHREKERYGVAVDAAPGEALVNDALEPPRYVTSGFAPTVDPGNPFGAADDNTSEFLSGRVSVAIFTPESAGGGENWSAARIAQVKAGIQNGMASLAAASPTSNLVFFYTYVDQCPTTIEPITMERFAAQDIYVPQCLTSAGFPSNAGNYFQVARDYARSIRNAFSAHWGVSMFVVDSLNDIDGQFAGGKFAYSYIAGPFLVMTYDNDGWGIGRMTDVSQHEISHSFWAFDEYASSNCTCTERWGYLNAQNQNCDAQVCASDSACVMRSDGTLGECVHSRAQMGINDSDGDGIPNVRDTFPNTTLDAFAASTADATPTLTGFATEVPLDNLNSVPFTTPSDISLNRIIDVQYRVDGGIWTDAAATDGAFSWAQEAFTLTTSPLPPGSHTIEVRGRNNAPNFETAPYASRTFLETSTELAPDTCDGAEEIPGAGPFPHMTALKPDVSLATSTGDPAPPSCASSVSRSLWYKVVPALSGHYTFSTCANATGTTMRDTVIQVFTSAGACSGFSPVASACYDNDCGGSQANQAVVSTDLVAGTTYFVLVSKRGTSPPDADEAAVQMRVERELPPTNDECSAAEVIPATGPFPYSTAVTASITHATSAGDPAPTCTGMATRSIWYSFTPAASGSYTISSCAGAPTATTVDDTVIHVVTGTGGTCAGFTPVASGCDDNGCLVENNQAAVTLDLTAGTTYFVVVFKRGTQVPAPGNTAVQLRVTKNLPLSNDDCAQAEIIPGSGPFPYLTGVTSDITAATSTGDPALPVCQASVSRSIWYRFTPDVTAEYTISSCADTPTGTTVDDTVIDVVSAAGGTCGGFAAVPFGCDDNGCVLETNQARVTVDLTAGTTYFVLVYKRSATPPNAGNTAVQLHVSRVIPPSNDLCSAALPLSLNVPVAGSTVLGVDDYRAPANASCFTGLGQSAMDARGRDVVYAFTAPAADTYAFRLLSTAQGSDPILYLSGACPGGPSPQTVSCIGGANRNTGEGSEEASCIPLSQGQTVYAFVDDRNQGFQGGPFVVEVETCSVETEANDTPATADPLACGVRGATNTQTSDFFALPDVPAGWRIFAIADGGAVGETNDVDLRVTTAVATLDFDDFNNDPEYGDQSANVAGTPLPGGPAYLKIDDSRNEEPYRLIAVVQPPLASAAAEAEPNGTIDEATAAQGDYVAGTLPGPGTSTDVDVYAVSAEAGDLIYLSLDADPLRDETPINGALALLDSAGTVLVDVDDNDSSSNNSPSGSLESNNPRSPAEAIAHRVPAAGTYYARVSIAEGAPIAAASGDYLLSIARGCASSAWSDLSVAIAEGLDPVTAGDELSYTITVTNAGPGAGVDVELSTDVPAMATFSSMTEPAGWGCTTPAPGGTGTAVCTAPLVPPGITVFTLVVTVDLCAQDGSIVTATAGVSQDTPDVDTADHSATVQTTVASSGDPCGLDDDGDGVPDSGDCAPLDPGAFVVPGEIAGPVFTDDVTLSWTSAVASSGPATVHDVARGTLGQWPVGSGAAESCLVPGGTAGTTATDAATPTPGTGRWYLVRGRNACGPGTYGDGGGAPRTTAVCP